MKNKKDINFYINELLDEQNNPSDYFYEYIHEEDQPVELIYAIIQLFKNGFLNNDNFSEKCRRNILEFHQESILEEDVLFLLNNDIVPIWKSYLNESLLNNLNDQIIDKYSKQILFWLLDNKINNGLLIPLLLKAEYDYYSLNSDQIEFIKETFSNDFFLDDYKNLKSLYSVFIPLLSEKELYRLIDENDLLEYIDHEDDISLNFLKDYLKINYPKNPTNFKIELDYVYENDKKWVEGFLQNIEFNKYYHYEYLDANFLSHIDLFKNTHDDVILEYYERHEDILSEENLELMLNFSEQIPLNIISNMSERSYSNRLLKKSFLKLDKFFVYGTERLDYNQINFADIVYLKILEKLRKGEYEISSFNDVDFSKGDINELSSFINEDFYLILLDFFHEEKEFKLLYEKNNSESLIFKSIEDQILKAPVDFIVNTEFSLRSFAESIVNNYENLTQNEIIELIKVHDAYKVINKYIEIIDKKVIIENISLLHKDEIKFILRRASSNFTLKDIYHINTKEINSLIFESLIEEDNDFDLTLEDFIVKRPVDSKTISSLLTKLEDENLLRSNFLKILNKYNSREDIHDMVYSFIYSSENKEKYLDLMMENVQESYTLYEILREFNNEYSHKYLKYKSLLNKEDLKKISENDIIIDYFIGRIDDLASVIKIQEDSKGIHLFLPNGTKLVTYSSFRNKFNKSKYDFTDNDYIIFNFLISEIIELPKRLRVKINSLLEYEVIDKELSVNILNLDEMQKWFDFYDVDPLEVNIVRINKDYVIDFGVGKDKREQTLDFLKDVRKLDLTQLDNLIQDRNNFNLKRGYGIETEFSIRCERYPENQEEWINLDFEKLIKYIQNDYENFFEGYYSQDQEEYIQMEKENKGSGLDKLIEDFTDYLYNNDLEEYNVNEEFDYLGERLTKTVKKYDQKKRSMNYSQEYYSSSGETWDLKTDSSVDDSDYGILGVEIASPILYGKSDLNVFKKILNDFVGSYYDIDVDRAGVHVHHDVRDYKDAFNDDMDILRRELYPVQEMLFNVISSERSDGHNAHFCKKYSVEDLRYNYSDKDTSINFKPDDTIEFRMKEGTTDIEDIANWVALTHDITDKIVKNLIRSTKRSIEKKKSIFDKIILAAQAVSKRNIVDKDQIETLMEMYNSAREFQIKSESTI